MIAITTWCRCRPGSGAFGLFIARAPWRQVAFPWWCSPATRCRGERSCVLCHEAATLEELLRAIADIGGQPGRAARACELLQRVDEHLADPLPGSRGMDVEHVDALGTGKRCEAHRRSVDGAEQGQRVGEPRGEGGFVVRHRRPGLLLARAVVVAGQLGDAGAEDFS